jgi:2-oxoacid:acceptor oxidoreductase gamma subunit (pyruvate/2-ketoisovalerate family)
MKEIRLHGRGGQGVVKASQIIVKAAVNAGSYGQFIPFFGVERKGSPVFGFLRLDTKPIRRKMQVYEPEILLIFDDTLVELSSTYEGFIDGGVIIINSKKTISELHIPKQAKQVAIVDATGISLKLFGKNIPNTAMLGAFVKVTGLVDWNTLLQEIGVEFGESNKNAATQGYEQVVVCNEINK